RDDWFPGSRAHAPWSRLVLAHPVAYNSRWLLHHPYTRPRFSPLSRASGAHILNRDEERSVQESGSESGKYAWQPGVPISEHIDEAAPSSAQFEGNGIQDC